MGLLTFRTPKTFGCTVASTTILQSLRERFINDKIVVYTRTPDLIFGLEEVDKVIDANKQNELPNYDINLANFLETQRPQLSKPYRHLTEHMFEVAERQFGQQISIPLKRDFAPKINLTTEELRTAEASAVSITEKGKFLVWLQTKSRLAEKELPPAVWEQLSQKRSSQYTFIDLSNEKYSRRQSIALTKFCKAGITLDTFLLHGSEAVHAPNVVVILVISHPEVVTYPEQIVLNGLDNPATITAENIIRKLDYLVRA